MNLFKKTRKENEPHDYFLKKIGKDPRVDWTLIVSLGFVLCMTLVSFGVFKYIKLESRLEQDNTPKAKIDNVIDVKVLDGVLSEYNERVNIRDGFVRQYVGPKDPSI